MRYKLLLFCFFFLSLMMLIVDGWRLFGKNKSIDKYKVYPLIFIKTDEGYRLPIDFDYGQETKWIQGHERKFKTYENESEIFFCPAINKTTENSGTKRKRNGTPIPTLKRMFSLNHEVSQACTVAKAENSKRKTVAIKCDLESEPTIWRVNVSAERNSKENELQLEIYGFGYKICTKNTPTDVTLLNNRSKALMFESTRTIHFEIYDFYYSIENKEVYMTLHRIRSRVLLFHKKLEKERKVVYEDDTYGFDFFRDEFSKRKELLDAIEKNSNYRIQKLIPTNDFPFALWRKATYHYINTGLMHEKLQKLWDTVEDKIREQTQFEIGTINIYTGAFRFSIPEKYLKKMQITNHVIIHEGYFVPQVWVKLIHCEYEPNPEPKRIIKEMLENRPVSEKSAQIVHKVLVIIANNYLNRNLLKFIKEKFCPENLCENFGKQEYPEVHEHIRCCFVTKNTLLLLNLDPIFNKVFIVKGLVTYPPEIL